MDLYLICLDQLREDNMMPSCSVMLGMSDLLGKLQKFKLPNGEPYVIYGDPAYGLSRNILSPFRGAHITATEQEFNKSMSRVRISVEWGFGKILQYFSFLDFRKNQKVILQPIGKYFLVASITIVTHVCMAPLQVTILVLNLHHWKLIYPIHNHMRSKFIIISSKFIFNS